uniref:PHD finger protein 10 n=1 Tax=Timema douglasi TaxID=61478 RepID=A0A7R8VCA4_TIMDO|nr:unnamed protein product [Timema douglasi]
MSIENSRPTGEDMACSSTSHHSEVISDNSTVTSSLSKKPNLVTSDPQSSSDITTSNSEVSTSSSHKIKIKNKEILKTSASELISKSDTSPGAKVENQSSLSFSNINQSGPSAIEDMNTSPTQNVFQLASLAPEHIKSESNAAPFLASDKPFISADVGESPSLNKLTDKNKISVILVDAANSSQPGLKNDTDTNIFRTHEAPTLKSGIGSEASLLEIDSSTTNMPLIDIKKSPGDARDKKALIEESAPTHSSPKVLVSPEMLSEVDPKYDSTSQTPARVCDTMESSKQIKESKEIRNNDEAQKNNTRAIEENSARKEKGPEKIMLKLKKDSSKPEIFAVTSPTEIIKPSVSIDVLKPGDTDIQIVDSPTVFEEPIVEKITLKRMKDSSKSDIFVATTSKDIDQVILDKNEITLLKPDKKTLKPRKDQENVGIVEKNVSSSLRDENKLEKLTLKLKKDHATSEITAEKKAKDSVHIVSSQTSSEQVSTLKSRKDQENVGLVEKNVSSSLRDENKLEKLTLKLTKDHATSEIAAEKKAKDSEHIVSSQTPSEHVSTLKPSKDQEDVGLVEKNKSSSLRDENKLEKLTLKLKKDHASSEITAEKQAKDSEHIVSSQTPSEHVSTLKPSKDQEDVGLVEKIKSSSLRDENKLEKLTLKLKKDHVTSEITAEKKAKDSEHIVSSQTSSEHVSTLKPRKDQEDVGLVEKNISSSLRDENKLEKLTLKLTKDHVTSEITAEKKAKDSEHTVSSLTPCEHVSTEIKKLETKAKEEKVEKLTIKFKKDSFSSGFIKELNVDSQKIDTISGMSHSSMEATKTDGQGQEGGKVEKLTLKLRKDTKVSEGSGGTKKVSEEFSVICDQDDSPSQQDKKNTSSFDQELLKEEKLEKITLKLNKDSSSLSISPKCHLKAVNADSEKTDKHSLKRKKELEVSCTSAEKKVKIGESSEDKINTEGIKDRICSTQQTSQPDIKPKEANVEKCYLKLKEELSNKVDCETTTDRKQISNELTVKPGSLDTMGNSKEKQAKEKHLDKIILKPDRSIDEQIVDNLNAKQLLHKERVETLQVVSPDQNISTVQQIKDISEGSMTKSRDLSHASCSQENLTISTSKSELKSSSLVEINSSGKCEDNLLKTKENTFGVPDKSAITDSECKRENKDHNKSQVDPIKSSSMPDEIKIDLSKSTKKDYLSKQIKMGSNSEASASIVAVSDQYATNQSSISKSSKKDDLSKQIKTGSNSESTTSIVAVSDLDSNIQSSISKSTKKDDLSKQIKTGTSFESTSSLVTDQDTKVQSNMSKTKEHKSDETPTYPKSNIVKISSDATEYAPNKILTSKNILANETKPEKITLTLKKAAAWSVKQPEGKGGGKQLRAKDTEVSLLVHQSDILLKDSSNKEIFEKPKNRDLLAGKDMTSKIGNTSPSAHIVANPSASSESLAVLTGSNQLDGNKTTSTAFNLTVKPEIATKKRESDTMEVIPPCKILKIGDSNAATLQGKSEVDRKITQSRCQAISRKRSSEEDNVGMGKSLKKLLKTDTKVHDIQVTSQLSRSKGETTLKTSKTKHLPTLGKEAIEKYSKVEDKSMSATLRKVNTLQTKPETQTNVETTSAHTTNIPKSSSKEIRSLFSPPTKCTKLENKILTSTSSLEREMKEKLSLPSLATKHPNLEIKTVESSQTTLLPITDRKRSTSPIKQFSASTSKGNTIHSPTHTDQTQKSSGALKVSAEDKLREILSRMGSRASSVLNSEISITLAPSKSTKPSGNFVETYNSGASDDIHFLDEVTSNEDDVSINLTPQISSVVKEGDDSSSQDIVILEEKITSPRSSSLTHQSGLFGLTPDLMDPLVFNERLVGPQINIATEFKQMFEGIKLPKKGRGRPRKLATDTNLKTKAPLVGNTCTNPTRPKRMCRGREERPLVAPKEKKPRAPGPGRGRGRKKKENEISRPGMPHILMKKPKLNLTSVATPGLIIPTTKIIKENISIETSAARPTTLEKTRPPTETPVAMTTSKMTTHTPVRVISESPYLTPGRVISESPYPTPGRVISESLCPAPIQAILDSPCPTPIRIDPESLCPTPIQVISESPCPTPVRVSESPYPTPVRAISESPCPTPIRVISEAPCPIPVRAISESPCPTPVSSTVQVFEEETRMSAESNSRSQTPARSLPPAVSVEGPGEESQGSVISTATTESNKNKKNRMEIPLDTDKEFTVDMISEYQWPLDKTGEHLMIQEQISQYLGVKSFKRKYPDIRRRPVEAEEKTYLRDKGLVSEYMSDLGLTAVISSEILDIMYADFQEKYEEYRRFMRDRQAKEFTTKQKAISAVTSGEKSKQDYKEKALSSAANWNATFNRNRREQRRSCFDLQSFTIQYPSNRCLKMTPEETPKVGDYPIALIPGQFTDFYKAYTPTELRYFPLNTVLYGPMKPNERQDPAIVSDDSQSDSDDSSSSNSSSSSSSSDDSADSDDSESSSGEAEPESTQEQVKEGETDKEKEKEKLRDATATCKVCSGDKNKNKESKPELLIHCGQCTSSSHPSCLDLTLDMVPHIKRYNWQCTDCKTCIQCKDPADEDKMLFCDMCDRGYHIYCVGLRRVPSGRWHCKECAVCGSCGTQQPAGNNDIPNAQWQHEVSTSHVSSDWLGELKLLWRKGRYCQLCWRCYGNKPDEEEGLINCSVCDKWMHAECCSAIGGNDLDRSSNFLCENCQEKGQARSSTIKTIPRTVVKV